MDRENEARQKSRAIWLLCGDENTPFFHKFANHRKFINSIWKIVDDGGNVVEGFESIAGAGVQHFDTLFQADENLHLSKILEIADKYPSDISEAENLELMIPVTLGEIHSILSASKNDKSPGPNGIPVEVYKELLMSWEVIF